MLKITFTDVEKSDTNLYCEIWFANYVLQQSMTIGTSMISVLINIVTIQIL